MDRTRYPGVFRVAPDVFRVVVSAIHPRTGLRRSRTRLYRGLDAREAARRRSELLGQLLSDAEPPTRQRVADYARDWMASKQISLDANTARTYAKALEQHVLPALGAYWYDALRKADVQRWVDRALRTEWTTRSGTRRRYSRAAVHGWFRVLRTMTKDAIDTFELPRDPCARIRFPPEELSDGSNALTPAELAAFLAAMQTHFPHHHALVMVLAFTGLRFCHASALTWDDWDEAAGLLRIRRKQVRGVVSSLTRKKRAPGTIPVEPLLAAALRDHRDRQGDTHAPGHELGWMFPSEAGTLRTPNTMDKAWAYCLAAAGIKRRFTLHGLRYTFTDLIRLSHADAVVRRALTGHVTQEMQDHYSNVGTDEKRAAIAGAVRLVEAASKA